MLVNQMRIDPKGTIAGKPALLVRKCLRTLQARPSWDLAEVEVAASLEPGSGRSLLRGLAAAGLVERVGRGRWQITQSGQRLSSASAASPISRKTAETALNEFLERVERVNRNARFLGRVNRVVLFGSFLREEVDRLSDVDVAVEVVAKIADQERLAARNRKRVEALLREGHVFRSIIDVHFYWYREVFRFLKGCSRIISLLDYAAEKSLVLRVPHRMLLGEDEPAPVEVTPEPPTKWPRRPRDCPF
jgi:predicted nucleotidyltransferase